MKLPAHPGDGCWNRIGVWGQEQPRCPALESIFHCRECPVYLEAGRRLLNRECPEDWVDEATGLVAAAIPPNQDDFLSVLVFRLGDEYLAMPTCLFHTIVPMVAVHHLPHVRKALVKGLVVVAGRIHICISLGNLLGVLGATSGPQTPPVLAVAGSEQDRYAFPVTSVHSVARINPSCLESAGIGKTAPQLKFVKGFFDLEGTPVALLAEDLLFEEIHRGLG